MLNCSAFCPFVNTYGFVLNCKLQFIVETCNRFIIVYHEPTVLYTYTLKIRIIRLQLTKFPISIFFILDTPSTNRLLPLVNLSNLQITSRGRVVFNVIPAGQMNSDNGVTPFSDTSFLSPEYLSSVGKKTSFSESDIEKVKYTQLSLNCK